MFSLVGHLPSAVLFLSASHCPEAEPFFATPTRICPKTTYGRHVCRADFPEVCTPLCCSASPPQTLLPRCQGSPSLGLRSELHSPHCVRTYSPVCLASGDTLASQLPVGPSIPGPLWSNRSGNWADILKPIVPLSHPHWTLCSKWSCLEFYLSVIWLMPRPPRVQPQNWSWKWYRLGF